MKRKRGALSTAAVFLKDVSRHRVMKTPDHFDGSLTLVTNTISRTQENFMKVNKYDLDGILEIQDAAQSYD